MAKNDLLFKILFAVQVALLPVVYAFDLIETFPTWAVTLAIVGVLLCKIWAEVFKDKHNLIHKILSSVATVATFAALLFFMANKGIIAMWLAILTLVLIVLFVALSIILRSKIMPELIEAIDYCFILFEILTLLAFSFAFYHVTMTNIGIFAIVLSTAVSVAYKLYFCIKYLIRK